MPIIFKIKDIKEIDDTILREVVKIINSGGIISFPTETVYALAADAASEAAVKRIYEIKKRTSNKPLSLLVGDIYQAKTIVKFDERANKLALRFLPGPITLVLKTKEHGNISRYVNNDIGTVGIRMPDHLLSLKILKAIGRPLVGTSANISGFDQYSTTGEDVISHLGNEIDLIIDSGKCELASPSTVVDLSGEEVKCLRIGNISEEEIKRVLEI